MYRKLSVVKRIAKKLNIEGKIEVSNKANKRFMITLDDNTIINFGQWPYKGRGTFIDHHDEKIKSAWQARHRFVMKDGEP